MSGLQSAGSKSFVQIKVCDTEAFYEVIIAGVPHGRDVDYVIGYPFYNDTLGNITGIVPEQTEWTYIDRNMSEFMQDTWMNFTKYGFDRSPFVILRCSDFLHIIFWCHAHTHTYTAWQISVSQWLFRFLHSLVLNHASPYRPKLFRYS